VLARWLSWWIKTTEPAPASYASYAIYNMPAARHPAATCGRHLLEPLTRTAVFTMFLHFSFTCFSSPPFFLRGNTCFSCRPKTLPHCLGGRDRVQEPAGQGRTGQVRAGQGRTGGLLCIVERAWKAACPCAQATQSGLCHFICNAPSRHVAGMTGSHINTQSRRSKASPGTAA